MKTLLLLTLFSFLLTSPIELEKRSLLDNSIELLIPKDFTEMEQEYLERKYPGKNRPKLVLTNEATTTNIGFSLLDVPADSTVIEAYKESIKGKYKQSFTTATWIKEGMASINGKKVGYFKIITDAIDQRIYNYLFLTDVNGKLLVGTFNCLEKDKSEWVETADKIVGSLKVK